ncbi:MAG: universal stress protein [Thermomicrobiales bacterium]
MADMIVVPLDGSALAERALPYAQALAERADAHVLLLRAVPDQGAGAGQSSAALAVADDYLRAVAGRISPPSRAVDSVVLPGDGARVVTEHSVIPGVVCIAMSTHGHSGRGRWLFGGTADKILRQSHAPVLLVPSGGECHWSSRLPQGILVPLDGSALAEAALEPAATFARLLGIPLTLLLVGGRPYEMSGFEITAGDPTADIAGAQIYLEERAAPLRATGLAVATRVEVGYPATVIASVAEEGAMLVALTTHGYGGAAHLVLGSIATSVVRRSDAPVLLVRPPALREDAAAAPATDRIQVALTRGELALIDLALRELLVGDYPAEPLRALLSKLEGMVGAAPEE